MVEVTATWLIILVVQLTDSNAQLSQPGEPVCVGNQVVLSCEQTDSQARWTVTLLSGVELRTVVMSADVGRIVTFENDPEFAFELHALSGSSALRVFSELRVTAARQLDGVSVECLGPSGIFTSTIQVALVDPPSTPSGVMTTVDESQFTPSTTSITLTWSASSGADNYTIMVTPPLPSGQSLLSTNTTSWQLTVLYNEEYSINITAHNCAGRNSTVVPIRSAGCKPPSPPANGRISEHSSGAVGAMLTFQCEIGFMPQEVVSTCLSNGSWVPIPQCEVIDCGVPLRGDEVVIEPFNETKFNAMITFHCEESITPMVAVCRSNGEWMPNPLSFECLSGTLVSQCGPPTAPVNGFINSNYSWSTVEGSQITFHCGGDSPVMTSNCSNGSWIPDPANLDCEQLTSDGGGPNDDNVVGGLNPGLIATIFITILLVVITLTTIVVVIIAIKKRKGLKRAQLSYELDFSNQDSIQEGSEYAQTKHPGPRINNQAGGEYSVLSQTTPSEKLKTEYIGVEGDTLVYADIGPSSIKHSTSRSVAANIQGEHRVVYSTVNTALQQSARTVTHNKPNTCSADKSLDLDSLLIQLKPQVIDKWEQFAEAVGLSNIIQQLSKYSPDECIVEVFDQWLKSHPIKPTWRNVADVLNDIGLHQLAEDILKVYETGNLPIVVDMDSVPENLTSDNGKPPPLPPKLEDSSLDYIIESVQHGERSAAVPPRPPKPPARPPKPVF